MYFFIRQGGLTLFYHAFPLDEILFVHYTATTGEKYGTRERFDGNTKY
jgi:hypothetical protein